MKEFKVNEYITLKLEEGKTKIFVKGELFNQCKFLLLDIPIEKVSSIEDIKSIDEAADKLRPTWEKEKRKQIDSKTEFWGHCSNMQVWAENDYDTRMLHRTLSFPLLKRLTEIGDKTAKKLFKEEIAKRFSSCYSTVMIYLLNQNYLNYLNQEEKETLVESIDFRLLKYSEAFSILEKIIENEVSLARRILERELIERVSKGRMDVLNYIIEEKYQDYVNFNDFQSVILKSYNKDTIVEIFNKLAQFYIGRHEFLKAIKLREIIVEINPTNDFQWLQLGNLYKNKNMFKKALFAYQKALELNPLNLLYRCYMGKMLMKLGNIDKALEILNLVLSNDNKYLRFLDKDEKEIVMQSLRGE